MVDISYAINMFSQGNVFAFPVLVFILLAVFYVIIVIFLKWNKESNNPYFFYELMRQHKNYVTVIYIKELNKTSFIIDDIVKEPYGPKGLFFRKYNILLPLMEELIVKGSKTNYVFAKVFSSNAVVPIKIVDIQEIKEKSDEQGLALIKGLEEKQNLFLEHNFSTLARAQTEIAKRGQGILGFLRENTGAIVVLIAIVLGMAFIYVYSSDTAKKMQENNLAQFNELKSLYASFYEKQQFCDKIVAKYATEWEKTIYYNLPSPFDKNVSKG